MILAGGILHLVVVLLPLVCLGRLVEGLRDPATLVFVAGACALYAGDAVTMRWPIASSGSPLNGRAKRWAAVTGAALLVLFWTSLAERALTGPLTSKLQIVGSLLLFSGVWLRAIAVRTLGRDFRTEIDVPDAVSMVRHGVYRFLRHPSETGLLAAALGAVFLLQSSCGLAIWCAALLPVTLVRLTLEERALRHRFGEEYQRYIREVGALLPLATRGF